MALLQRQVGLSFSKVLFGTPTLSSIPQSTTPLLPSIVLPTLTITLPGFLTDIWEGILKAVPKKKTSHMKRRHRQYAGKALKDVQSLNSCPGCGRTKKAHHICPYCWSDMVVGFNKVKNTLLAKTAEQIKPYTPTISKKEIARADKWIDIVAQSKGEDLKSYRAALGAEYRRIKAEESAEAERSQPETTSKPNFVQRLLPRTSAAPSSTPSSTSSSAPSKFKQSELDAYEAAQTEPTRSLRLRLSRLSRGSRSVNEPASSSSKVDKPVYKTRRERRSEMRATQTQTN